MPSGPPKQPEAPIRTLATLRVEPNKSKRVLRLSRRKCSFGLSDPSPCIPHAAPKPRGSGSSHDGRPWAGPPFLVARVSCVSPRHPFPMGGPALRTGRGGGDIPVRPLAQASVAVVFPTWNLPAPAVRPLASLLLGVRGDCASRIPSPARNKVGGL